MCYIRCYSDTRVFDRRTRRHAFKIHIHIYRYISRINFWRDLGKLVSVHRNHCNRVMRRSEQDIRAPLFVTHLRLLREIRSAPSALYNQAMAHPFLSTRDDKHDALKLTDGQFRGVWIPGPFLKPIKTRVAVTTSILATILITSTASHEVNPIAAMPFVIP